MKVLSHRKKYANAMEVFRQAFMTGTDYRHGLSGSRVRMFKKAIGAFQEVIRDLPHFSNAYYMLGLCCAYAGMPDQACEAYEHAINIDPDLTDAHYQLGLFYEGAGVLDEAIEAYEHTISIDPDFTDAHYHLGSCYEEIGMFGKAIDAYLEAIRTEPDFVEAYFCLTNSYEKAGMIKRDDELYEILNDLTNEHEDKKYGYQSFYQNYNFFEQTSNFTDWEGGDKDGEFEYVDNATYGYWDDFYSDREVWAGDDCGGCYICNKGVIHSCDETIIRNVENDNYGNWIVFNVPDKTLAADIGLMIDDKILAMSWSSENKDNESKSVRFTVLRRTEKIFFTLDISCA